MSYRKKQYLSGEHHDSYDAVPDQCFRNAETILDIGCMSGINAILSHHRPHFIEAESRGGYLGVDLLEYSKNYLEPIIISDIMAFDTDRRFDLVLALHVVEHLPIELWPRLFAKLKAFVARGGTLVVSTPYRERDGQTPAHSVFGITKDMMSGLLENAILRVRRRPYRHFRDYDEGYLWPFLRAVWRLLTRHPYRYGHRYGKEIMAVWTRPEEKREQS